MPSLDRQLEEDYYVASSRLHLNLIFRLLNFFCVSPFYPVQLDSILENFFKILVICFNSKQTVLKAFWECCKILSIKIWMLQKVFWEAALASGPARMGGCWSSSSWTTPWCPPSPSASWTPASPSPRTRGTSSMRRWWAQSSKFNSISASKLNFRVCVRWSVNWINNSIKVSKSNTFQTFLTFCAILSPEVQEAEMRNIWVMGGGEFRAVNESSRYFTVPY